MNQEEPKCGPVDTSNHRPTERVHPLYKVRRLMGLQQCQDKTRRRMKSSLPDSRRTLRAHSYVLRADKLTGDVPKNDEYHLQKGGSQRMDVSLHG